MRYQVRLHPTLDVLVSSIGEVFVPASGVHKAHWTFGSKKNDGYLLVRVNGKNYRVHRLVAEAFIPNPGHLPEVEHLNRNRADNRAFENLSWVTHSQNNRNRIDNDLVDARGGTHRYEDERQYYKEKNERWRKTHKLVRFSDGGMRWLPISEAIELLKIPVKDRI